MSQHPDLARLTGVRSGKTSYYPAYRRGAERTQRALRAMERISRAVVRTVEGPRGLLEEVALAAADHVDARWALLALGDEHLVRARPRFVLVGPDREIVTDLERAPEPVRLELSAIRAGYGGPAARTEVWVRVPMYLEGRRIGGLAALHQLPDEPEPDDLAMLRILANQAAVSLHTSEQYQAGLTLHRRAEQLNAEARAQAVDLAQRTAQLEDAEHRIAVAQQRELIDVERHRIARELHDSVTQTVLSAGMSVELARGQAEGVGDRDLSGHLETAKALTQGAVEQLRSTIFALSRDRSEDIASLEDLLTEVAQHHAGLVAVSVRAAGHPHPLGHDVHHEIARAVGEALFNIVVHAAASTARVQITWRPGRLTVTVSDDGTGDPRALRRLLRLERDGTGDGRHRGLANIESRMRGLDGDLAFRRAALGGVAVRLRVPLPVETARSPTEEVR